MILRIGFVILQSCRTIETVHSTLAKDKGIYHEYWQYDWYSCGWLLNNNN
jgi:hypothetical protein